MGTPPRPDHAGGYLASRITDEPLWIHPLALRRLAGCRRLLDVGCGIGKLQYTFPDRELIGVDIRAGGAVCVDRGYARFIQADLDEGALPALEADGLVLSHVLEHFQRPERALARALAALAPGAVVYAACPTAKNPKYWDDYTHVRPFTERMLATLLSDAGLVNVRVLHRALLPFPGGGRLLRLLTGGDPEREQRLAERFPRVRERLNVCAVAECPGRAAPRP